MGYFMTQKGFRGKKDVLWNVDGSRPFQIVEKIPSIKYSINSLKQCAFLIIAVIFHPKIKIFLKEFVLH